MKSIEDYLTIIIIIKILLLIFISLTSFYGKIRQIVYECILIYSFICYYDLLFSLVNLIFFISGYLVAPMMTRVIFIFFSDTEIEVTTPKFNLYEMLSVFCEEYVFRLFFLKGLSIYSDNIFYIIFVILLTTFCFVKWHKVTSYLEQLDMFFYSLLLGICVYINPFLSIGLHVGRNCFINILQERGGDFGKNY